MHRHRRLSGASHALYDQIRLRGSADNEVLLLLDRRNDLTEHRFLFFARYFVSSSSFATTSESKSLSDGHFQSHTSAFFSDQSKKYPLNSPYSCTTRCCSHNRRRKSAPASPAQPVPPSHRKCRRARCNRTLKRKPRILKVNPPEIRLLSRFFQPRHAVLVRIQLRRRVVPERQAFRLFLRRTSPSDPPGPHSPTGYPPSPVPDSARQSRSPSQAVLPPLPS